MSETPQEKPSFSEKTISAKLLDSSGSFYSLVSYDRAGLRLTTGSVDILAGHQSLVGQIFRDRMSFFPSSYLPNETKNFFVDEANVIVQQLNKETIITIYANTIYEITPELPDLIDIRKDQIIRSLESTNAEMLKRVRTSLENELECLTILRQYLQTLKT